MASRQEIREYVKNILTNCHVDIGDKVYSNRVSAYWNNETPCVSIFTRDEEATPRNLQQKQYIRKMSLLIEIHAVANEDLDLKLDTYADAVENIIESNNSVGGLATNVLLESTSIELSETNTTQAIGVLSLTYQVTYIK